MFPIDMRHLYLWMGLTHPLFGPANLAWYMTFVGYANYVAWVGLLMNAAAEGEKKR